MRIEKSLSIEVIRFKFLVKDMKRKELLKEINHYFRSMASRRRFRYFWQEGTKTHESYVRFMVCLDYIFQDSNLDYILDDPEDFMQYVLYEVLGYKSLKEQRIPRLTLYIGLKMFKENAPDVYSTFSFSSVSLSELLRQVDIEDQAKFSKSLKEPKSNKKIKIDNSKHDTDDRVYDAIDDFKLGSKLKKRKHKDYLKFI